MKWIVLQIHFLNFSTWFGLKEAVLYRLHAWRLSSQWDSSEGFQSGRTVAFHGLAVSKAIVHLEHPSCFHLLSLVSSNYFLILLLWAQCYLLLSNRLFPARGTVTLLIVCLHVYLISICQIHCFIKVLSTLQLLIQWLTS